MPVRQQRARGRKAKPESASRNDIVPVRLNGDEGADIRAAAARLSQPVSVFIRSVAVQEARRILTAA